MRAIVIAALLVIAVAARRIALPSNRQPSKASK
jgi:hypothetical protein